MLFSLLILIPIPSSLHLTRPFRVNAGPVHSYALLADGSTKYLSELAAGDQVCRVWKTYGTFSESSCVTPVSALYEEAAERFYHGMAFSRATFLGAETITSNELPLAYGQRRDDRSSCYV